MSAKPFTFPIKVLPDDIDFMGHVNNARYLNWVQDTVLAHWQKLAPAEEVASKAWVALKHEITYRRPAFLHDDVIAETVLEQHAGGDVYDRGVDGSICRWGRVLTFDPPHTIAFSWDIGPDWQGTTDLDRTSEVEVTFTPEGDDRTRVTLTHRHIERHGPGWESLREGLDAPDGWPLYLGRYDALTRGDLEAL